MKVLYLTLGVTFFALAGERVAAQPAVQAGDVCLVTAKYPPIQEGTAINGWLLRGTPVKAEKVKTFGNGQTWAKVSVPKTWSERTKERAVPALVYLDNPLRLGGERVEGAVEVSYLTPPLPLQAEEKKNPFRELDPVFCAAVNSTNGGLRCLTKDLAYPLKSNAILATLGEGPIAKNASREARASLRAAVTELTRYAATPSLDDGVKKEMTRLAQRLEEVETLLEIAHLLGSVTDAEYAFAAEKQRSYFTDARDALKTAAGTVAVVATKGAVGANIALEGAGDLLSPDKVKDQAELILKNRKRAKNETWKMTFEKLDEVNVIAGTLWNLATRGALTKRGNGLLVDFHEDALYRDPAEKVAMPHDRLTIWNNYDRTLTNCALKINVKGDTDRTIFQFVNEWKWGMPLVLELGHGDRDYAGRAVGFQTVVSVTGAEVQLACDQTKDILVAKYEYTDAEKRADFSHRLHDLGVTVVHQSKLGKELIEVLFDGGLPLESVSVAITVIDTDGKSYMKPFERRNVWKPGERIESEFSNPNKTFVPARIEVKIRAGKYSIERTVVRELK